MRSICKTEDIQGLAASLLDQVNNLRMVTDSEDSYVFNPIDLQMPLFNHPWNNQYTT